MAGTNDERKMRELSAWQKDPEVQRIAANLASGHYDSEREARRCDTCMHYQPECTARAPVCKSCMAEQAEERRNRDRDNPTYRRQSKEWF